MYTVTFKGITRKVSGAVFWSLAIPLLLVFVAFMFWFGWVIYLSATMLENFTGIPAVVCGLVVFALCVNFSVNGIRKALLPEKVQQGIAFILLIITFCYQYFVQHWSIGDMLLLTLPTVVALMAKIFNKNI